MLAAGDYLKYVTYTILEMFNEKLKSWKLKNE